MQATTIQWKSDDKNLTKLHPRRVEEDDEDDVLDPGSFFNYFEHADDTDDVSKSDAKPKIHADAPTLSLLAGYHH